MTRPQASGLVVAGARTGPLSSAQERLWFIDAAAPGSAAYNVPLLLRWRQRIDPEALAAALTALAVRHEVLRTVYRVLDGRPVQSVLDPERVGVEVLDCAEGPAPDAVALRARQPFDLAARPPLRCTVWRGAPDGDLMLLTIHHIAVDGWSLRPLFEDLADAYAQAVAGSSPVLRALPVQYLDYSLWEKAGSDAPALLRKLEERAEQLRSVPGDLVLGGGRPRRSLPEGARRGEQYGFLLDPSCWDAVGSLAARLRATPYTVLLAAFQVVVQRWSGREDFLLGTVAADRPLPVLEDLVGFFVNTVPLRCGPEPLQSFEELCLQVRAEAFRALTLSRLPYDRLSAVAGAERLRAGRGSLVDIGFGLQNMPVPEESDRVPWRAPELLPTGSAKFSLLLLIEERSDGVHGTVEYDRDLYGPEVAESLAEQFRELLGAALRDPGQQVCRLPLTRRGPGAAHPGVVPGEIRDLLAERLAVLSTGRGGGHRDRHRTPDH